MLSAILPLRESKDCGCQVTGFDTDTACTSSLGIGGIDFNPTLQMLNVKDFVLLQWWVVQPSVRYYQWPGYSDP